MSMYLLKLDIIRKINAAENRGKNYEVPGFLSPLVGQLHKIVLKIKWKHFCWCRLRGGGWRYAALHQTKLTLLVMFQRWIETSEIPLSGKFLFPKGK